MTTITQVQEVHQDTWSRRSILLFAVESVAFRRFFVGWNSSTWLAAQVRSSQRCALPGKRLPFSVCSCGNKNLLSIKHRFLSRAEKAAFQVTFLLRNTNTARGTESLFSAILTNAYFKICAPSAKRDGSRGASDRRAWEVRCRTGYGVVCTFISRSVQPFGILVR